MTDRPSNPFRDVVADSVQPLAPDEKFGQAFHRWSENEIDALTFAAAARRPLLVRGEAGCGKSQIARAAAAVTGGRLFYEIIHPRYEALDLLYRFDVVERLADAEVKELDRNNARYVKRGRLWDAIDELRRDTARLPVLLIDEIDKADTDVPNALLDVLGNRSFGVPHLADTTIAAPDGRMPLVVITTNEERELPPAFVRRCAVLNLNPPKDDKELLEWLVDRGSVHTHLMVEDGVRRRAAEQVVRDRADCDRVKFPPVGLAEYIDLLHALHELAPASPERGRGASAGSKAIAAAQNDMLDRLSRYALVKQPDQDQRRPPVPRPAGDDERQAS